MIVQAADVPTISVIIAAYNGAALLPETLASLQAQTLGDFEIIAVDDRSTDATLALLRSWPDARLRVIAAERNQGPVKTRNQAFGLARGRYIAALDQDDLCLPERFARQVAYLDDNPDVVLAGTAAGTLSDGIVAPSAHTPVTTPALIEWLLRIRNPIVWSSAMLRADAARRLDPFTRPELLCAEDFDLYHRLSRIGRIARLDEQLLLYRSHDGGMSKVYRERMLANATRVLAECHRATLGDDSDAAAALLVRHIMDGEPVPDGPTLSQLGALLLRLQTVYIEERNITGDDLSLIRWETARLWGRIGRTGLRTGAIGIGDAIAARTDHLGLGYVSADELVLSRLIGSARAVKARYAR